MCREGGLEDEYLPQWTKKVYWRNVREQVLEDVEARIFHQEYHVEEHGFPQARGSVKQKDEEPSRPRMSASSASCPQWEISCWWASTDHGERLKRKTAWVVGGAGACGQSYDWRKAEQTAQTR